MGTDTRRRLKLTAMVGTVGLLAVIAPPLRASAAAPKVAIRADNFRFCPMTKAQCLPTDAGNVVTVATGTIVTWTYTDTGCDIVVPCPGHNVRFGATGGK